MKLFFNQLQESYTAYAAARRDIIKTSGDALGAAKQVIFALHRDDLKGAAVLLKQVETTLKKLETKFKQEPDLRHEGSYRAALEEYVEAKMFSRVVNGQTIGSIIEVTVDTDSYLGGLCDLLGEIARKVVLFATERKFNEVKRLSQAAQGVMAELLKIDLTGYERTKFDQAKQALRRIEEVAYDISKM